MVADANVIEALHRYATGYHLRLRDRVSAAFLTIILTALAIAILLLKLEAGIHKEGAQT